MADAEPVAVGKTPLFFVRNDLGKILREDLNQLVVTEGFKWFVSVRLLFAKI